jgi:hypothetical protein
MSHPPATIDLDRRRITLSNTMAVMAMGATVVCGLG